MSTKETNQDHPPTRYERVKQILTAAAAGSTANYQGLDHFWNLPYEEFLKAEVYGVRMIAPELFADPREPLGTGQYQRPPAKKSGCCPAGGPVMTAVAPATAARITAGGTASQAGHWPGQKRRGARSGLIKGLKGEFPFDDSHFPRLPWGGSEVVGADIHFIEKWIDDDCPLDDAGTISGTGEEGVGEHCPHSSGGGDDGGPKPGRVEPANHFHHDQGQLKVRKNYEFLSPLELEELAGAVLVLKQLDPYPADNRSFSAWARVHGDHCQHGWEQFLTWHRAYLYKFELALQRVIPGVTLPYWDWPMDIYHGGMIPTGKESGIVPTALRCYLDDGALGDLRDGGEVPSSVLSRLAAIENQRFNSAWELFCQAGLTASDYHDYKGPIVAQLALTNPLWHPRRYPGMFYQTDPTTHQIQHDADGNPLPAGSDRPGHQAIEQMFHHHYPRRQDIEQILGITNWPDFGGGHFANQSFGILEQNPHNTGHIWVGGANPFWAGPGSNDPNEPKWGDMFNDLVAFFDPVGYAHHANIDRVFWQWLKLHPGLVPDDVTAELVPFDLRVSQVLDASKLGYEYVRDSSAFGTDAGQEIRQWSSGASEFAAGALQEGTKVEARFHGLHRAVGSYTVRVFLNQPGADASTPTTENEHYAGHFARFGHGSCVGGPGHCDPPGAPVSRFEIQPRHHNTPHNHRLDVTECAARLLAKGEEDLSLDLVVVDGNGGAAEGIKMDGVSIHLLD